MQLETKIAKSKIAAADNFKLLRNAFSVFIIVRRKKCRLYANSGELTQAPSQGSDLIRIGFDQQTKDRVVRTGIGYMERSNEEWFEFADQ